jgi:hypothetical protein
MLHRTGWSGRSEQVNAVFDSTTKTNNALSHVIANDNSPSAPFTETVGPVEIRLREQEGIETVWREEEDSALILFPQNFMELEGDNQDGGEWLVTGEYFVAADHRSFGKMSELLGATGIIHDGRTTSGNREHTNDWVYDEHGIFDYSGLGGPRNSSRENYDNDTHHHELSDMGKQWVFLNDLAQRYDSEVDLLHEIRNQQTTIPPELHPSELEILRERLDNPAYHVDRIRMAYRLGGLDGAITTGLNDFMEQHRHLSPAVYEAMLEEKIETATILSVNEQFRDILNAYDAHQTNLITMMNRNADLESFLSIAHATSQQWRDPDFIQSIMQDNQSADAILQSLSEQDLSNHARLSESFNNNSLKNIFDAYTPLNTIDGDSWNPTTLYETTYNLHDTLTYLVASTDWANEITSNPRNTVNGSNLATVQANLPDEVVALSNSHLAYSITEDLTDEDRARLVDLMDAHAQQHGYQQVDPPTVENYNLNRVMVGGLIGVSIASEVLGDSIDLVSATLSGLRGDAVGVAADLSGILAPRALGYLDDFVQGGRRLVNTVAESTHRASEYATNLIRRTNEMPDTMALSRQTSDDGFRQSQITGAEGPIYDGDVKGQYSGRPFDPSNAGGPIRNLSYENVRVTHTGIDIVIKHTERFGPNVRNDFMIQRLRQIADGKIIPEPVDLRYYTHEIREYVRYRRLEWTTGLPTNDDLASNLWNNAHTATLEDYRLHEGPGVLYHPDTPDDMSWINDYLDR